MKQKINLRLAVIAMIAIIATTIAITYVFYGLFERQVRDDLRVNAELISDTQIFQNFYAEDGDIQIPADQDLFPEMQQENVRITWVDEEGTVLYDNDADTSTLENHLDRPEIQEALKNGYGESIRQSTTLNMNTFYYAMKLDDGTVLRVATEARSITSVILAAFPLIAAIIILIMVICIWIAHMLTRQLIEPINQMAENLDAQSVEPAYKELIPFSDKIRLQHENILAAVRSRQDFTANITHELKTPLTAISGYAELIMLNTQDDQISYFSKQITQNSERLLSLINDIISLSELDHKEIARKPEDIDLLELVQECCDNLMVNAQKKNVRLSYAGENLHISAEKSLMKDLIVNLVQNSIQYNSGRADSFVNVIVREVQDRPSLIVSDNGIGIPKSAQDRIFERFYRVDKSRSKATGGTGLGLAIVKHIVEIYDAELTLDSEEGKGTTITVRF